MHPPHTHNINSKKGMRTYLRTHGTIAEIVMWRLLKSRQIDGVKFRRQFSVDNYILDFYCPELRLCINLMGRLTSQKREDCVISVVQKICVKYTIFKHLDLKMRWF